MPRSWNLEKAKNTEAVSSVIIVQKTGVTKLFELKVSMPESTYQLRRKIINIMTENGTSLFMCEYKQIL